MKIPAIRSIKISVPKVVKQKKVNPKSAEKIISETITAGLKKSEYKPVRKALPKSVSKQEATNISMKDQQRKVSACGGYSSDCGSFADWCNGGIDACGAYY